MKKKLLSAVVSLALTFTAAAPALVSAAEAPESTTAPAISVTQILINPTFNVPDFTYYLIENGTLVGTATGNTSGVLNFEMNSSYVAPTDCPVTLTMVEAAGSASGWQYNTLASFYRVTVSPCGEVCYEYGVTIDGSTLYYKTPVAMFVNCYPYPVAGVKTTIGNSPVNNIPTFNYVVRDSDGNTVGTASINSEGVADINWQVSGYDLLSIVENFSFNADGTLSINSDGLAKICYDINCSLSDEVFTISQVAGSDSDWTYDNSVYYMKISLGLTGYCVTYYSDPDCCNRVYSLPTFNNIYSPSLDEIKANVVIMNSEATNPTFTYDLYDGAILVASAKVNSTGMVSFSTPSLKPPTGYGSTKELTMALDSATIPAGWTCDTAAYTVVIHQDGSITYKDVNGNPIGTPTFVNTNSIVNINSSSTPTGSASGTTTIDESAAPLADNPDTGDSGAGFEVAAVAAGLMLAAGGSIFLFRRRRLEDR